MAAARRSRRGPPVGGPPARGPRGPGLDRPGAGRPRVPTWSVVRLDRGEPLPSARRPGRPGGDGRPDGGPRRRLASLAGRRSGPAARCGRRAVCRSSGVCLGAQQLAAALGAEVTTGPGRRSGRVEVELTADGRRDPVLGPEYNGLSGTTVPCVHWHRDTFALPDGAVHLAATRAFPHQAFRVGDRAYGLQFHVEVDAALAGRGGRCCPTGVDPRRRRRGPGRGRRPAGAAAVRRRGDRRRRRRSGDGERPAPARGTRPCRDDGDGTTGRRDRSSRSCGASSTRSPSSSRWCPGVAGVGRAHHLVEADLPGLRLLDLAAVRGERAVPPPHLGPGRPPADAPGRPLDDLHRHRRFLHGGGRHRPHRVGPDRGAADRVDRGGRRDHPAPGLARRARSG